MLYIGAGSSKTPDEEWGGCSPDNCILDNWAGEGGFIIPAYRKLADATAVSDNERRYDIGILESFREYQAFRL